MQKIKLTDWFPPSVKPIHKGWYHTGSTNCFPESKEEESFYNWWWDGSQWCYFNERDIFVAGEQRRWWRGIEK